MGLECFGEIFIEGSDLFEDVDVTEFDLLFEEGK